MEVLHIIIIICAGICTISGQLNFGSQLGQNVGQYRPIQTRPYITQNQGRASSGKYVPNESGKYNRGKEGQYMHYHPPAIAYEHQSDKYGYTQDLDKYGYQQKSDRYPYQQKQEFPNRIEDDLKSQNVIDPFKANFYDITTPKIYKKYGLPEEE